MESKTDKENVSEAGERSEEEGEKEEEEEEEKEEDVADNQDIITDIVVNTGTVVASDTRAQVYQYPAVYTTDFIMFTHVTKTIFGASITIIPQAVFSAGILVASLGMLFVVFTVSHNIRRLNECAKYLSAKEKRPVRTYEQVALVSLQCFSTKTQRLSGVLSHIIIILMLATRIESATLLLIYMAYRVQALLNWYFTIQPDIRLLIVFGYLTLFLLILIRRYQVLFPLILVANVAIFTVIFTIIGCYFIPGLADMYQPAMHTDVTGAVRFASVTLYCMTGLTFSLSFKDKSRYPHHYFKVPGIFCANLSLFTVVFGLFGTLGYLCYGPAVQDGLFYLLDKESNCYLVASFVLVVSIYLSVPVIIYVGFNLFWAHYRPKTRRKWVEVVFRQGFFLLVLLLSVAYPDSWQWVLLKSGLFTIPLLVIIPAVLEFTTFYYTHTSSWMRTLRVFKLLLFLLPGLLLAGYSIFVGVQDIIDMLNTQEQNDTRSSFDQQYRRLVYFD